MATAHQARPPRGMLDAGLKNACLSILIEASEKCEELEVKLDEECRLLRRKLIRADVRTFEKIYKQRLNEVLRDNRVYLTKLINQSRLAHLQAQNDIIEEVKGEIKRRLATERNDRYTAMISKLIQQGMNMLMEKKVKVTCKKYEESLVTSCFTEAAKRYSEGVKKNVDVYLAEEFLPNNEVGGIIVSTMDGKITVDARLSSRLEDVCHQATPLIVQMIFHHVKANMTPMSTGNYRSAFEMVRPETSRYVKK